MLARFGHARCHWLMMEVLQETHRILQEVLIIYTILLGALICAGMVLQVLPAE